MSHLSLKRHRIRHGRYEGLLTTRARLKAPPVVEMRFLDGSVTDVPLSPIEGKPQSWDVRVTIPPHSVNDGVLTYHLCDSDDGEILDSFAIVCGEPLEDDLRAEIHMLRAELDMLKRSFRKHVLESHK